MQLYEIVLSSIHFGFFLNKHNFSKKSDSNCKFGTNIYYIKLLYQSFFGSYLYLDKIVHIF